LDKVAEILLDNLKFGYADGYLVGYAWINSWITSWIFLDKEVDISMDMIVYAHGYAGGYVQISRCISAWISRKTHVYIRYVIHRRDQ
jgi:hypothetical protein